MRFLRALPVLLAACGAAPHPHAPRTGGIAGLARDRDSGDPVAMAQVRIRAQGDLRGRLVTSGADGAYGLDHLAPGRYSLIALFAGQPVDVENIDVHAGETTVVDVDFTLGQPDPVHVDYGNPKDGEIERFKPPHHPGTALIEGTVNDTGTRDRVAGAVVTAVGGPGQDTLQAVTDDQGRFRFDPVPPGRYAVSAYYSLGGRGQIEVRRSDIELEATDGVRVPLWVELARR